MNDAAPPKSPTPRWLLLVVAVLLLWIYTYGIASNPLKWEEPRRSLVAMEMIHSGDYLVPQIMSEPYLKKPPLQNWLFVLASGNDAQRVAPITVRLVSLLALVGSGLLLWRAGSSVSRGATALPVLVFLTMGVVLQSGRSAEIDTLFTFFVFGALAAFELGRRRGSPWLQWCVPQLLVACGVLTKLLAPLFVYPPILFLAWRRRDRIRFAPLPFLVGFAASAGLVAAWMVPYANAQTSSSLAGRWLTEAVVRMSDQDWLGHLTTYPLLLVAWLLPWSLLPVFSGPAGWRKLRAAVGTDPWLGLCVATVLWGFLVFVFVPEHKGRYLLPIIPCFSVLVAHLAHELAATRPLGRWLRHWITWAVLGLAWFGLVVAFALRAPWPAPIPTPLLLGLLALGGWAYAAYLGRLVRPMPLLLLGLIYGIAYAGFAELREAERGKPYVTAARDVADSIQDDVPIVCHRDVKLKFCYELSRLVSKPLRRRAEPSRSTYWIAPPEQRRLNLGPPIAETPLYNLWRVDAPEAWSLLGEPLFPPALDRETRAERIRKLSEARAEFERHPDDPDAIIWLGRRTAYLGHYRKAQMIYGAGLSETEDDPRIYRHRGHRWITLREFDRAIADLERAAELIEGRPDEIEPDGLPNARNIPTSTLNSNIWYHLGLAYYLRGDLDGALRSYRRCLEFSRNADMLSATSHWLYMTLRRAGLDEEATALLEPIRAEMDVIENGGYHRLLLMYKGELTPDELMVEARDGDGIASATTAYGVANWHLYTGNREAAIGILRTIVRGDQWAAFGHIAAEADLARIVDRAL